MRSVGEGVVRRLLIDKHLMIKLRLAQAVKDAGEHEIQAIRFEPIEKVRASMLAKASLGPGRGVKDLNRRSVVESHGSTAGD